MGKKRRVRKFIVEITEIIDAPNDVEHPELPLVQTRDHWFPIAKWPAPEEREEVE